MSKGAEEDEEAQMGPVQTESQALFNFQGGLPDAGDYGTTDGTPPKKSSSRFRGFKGVIPKSSVEDSMTYHMEDLASWNSVFFLSFSVWHRKSLWMICAKLMLLAVFVAILVLLCCSDPSSLRAFKFAEIGQFLRVFVGLLLGFFMSASVQRWWACAGQFQNLLSAVRSLHIYMEGLGVSQEHQRTCLRYGVGSAWLLSYHLHVEAMDQADQETALKEAWDSFKTGEHDDFEKFTDEEIEALQSVGDPAGALWLWIGSMVGFLAQEGEIPPLASPTYGRIMGTVYEGFNAIRDVRSLIGLQAPYIYVQMLSSLVHINNIINAISFGLTSGAAVGTILLRYGFHVYTPAKVSEEEATVNFQSLIVCFFLSCFGPFVYQALLEVSVAIAQPFSNKDAVVPTHRMIKAAERDLHDAIHIATKVSWPRPHFKKPAS